MSDHSSISDGSCGSDHDELIDGESDSGAASPPLSDDEADGDDGYPIPSVVVLFFFSLVFFSPRSMRAPLYQHAVVVARY